MVAASRSWRWRARRPAARACRRCSRARNQRQRRAAAAVEPAAHIDIERRIEAGIAEQPHEQAVADIELPGLAERRNVEARRRSTSHRRSPASGCRTSPAIRPITTPPNAVPSQPSELASDGAERAPPRSAAIDFRPTAVIQSAPNEIESSTTDTLAATQEDRVSMLGIDQRQVPAVDAAMWPRQHGFSGGGEPSPLSAPEWSMRGVAALLRQRFRPASSFA